MTKRVRISDGDDHDDEHRSKRKGKSKLLEQYHTDEESESIAKCFKKKAKSKLLDQEMMPSHNQLKQNDFFKGLIHYGISVRDVEKLQAAAVYTWHDLLNRTKKNLRIKDLSDNQVRKICEAAHELVNDGRDTASDDKIKVRFPGDLRKPMKPEEKGKTVDSSKELIIKNLAFGYQESQLIGELKKFGKGVKVESVYEGDMFTGSAKATFESSEDAQKAMALNGKRFFRRDLVLERADCHQENQIAEQPFVVVKKLPRDIIKQQVRDHFKECGRPTKVDISSPYQSKYRCAFIRYASHASIEKALKLSGSLFQGQKIIVELGESSRGRPY